MFKLKRKSTQPRSIPFSLPARCACCLSWPDMINAVSVFVPPNGGDPVPYVLCQQCAQSATRGEKATIKAIETYLTDATQPKRTTADQT